MLSAKELERLLREQQVRSNGRHVEEPRDRHREPTGLDADFFILLYVFFIFLS